MVPLCWLTAYWLRFTVDGIAGPDLTNALAILLYVMPLQCLVLVLFGLYRGIWRFASIPDLIRIVKAVLSGCIIILLLLYFSGKSEMLPRSIVPIYGMSLLFLLGGSRLLVRCLRDYNYFSRKGTRALIIGAGSSGESLVRDLLRDTNKKIFPVAFIDDKSEHQGQELHGVRVLGRCKDIPKIAVKHNIELLIIALPSANSVTMRKIIACCEATQLPVRTLDPSINMVREVSVEDLLGRDQVKIQWREINNDINNKNILITGGGGSIGSELCRQIIKCVPKELVIVDKSEFNLFTIIEELKALNSKITITGYTVDILDAIAIEAILAQHRPEIILHAAAYKHVPLLEHQIRIAMQNNILGLEVIAKLASQYNVAKFVFVSTDKAVNPTNIMGASKRAGEIICHYFNDIGPTKFVMVRFGNVLGSAGSVVPIFKRQLAKGGPLTVTHPEITRFFMTIPESCQLILQAFHIGTGGEVFVLDMGKPIKISFLAEQMIRLSGKTLDEIAIKYTGLRPGEKLYEELFYNNEILSGTEHGKIMQTNYAAINNKLVAKILQGIRKAVAKNDIQELYRLLQELVPEFKS